MNNKQLIENATTNNIYMKKLTYKELCVGLNIEPQRGGYRQRQLNALDRIFMIHKYETTPTTYRITKPKPQYDKRFCIEPEYAESYGGFVIKCEGYDDYYGETENYIKRFKELIRDKRTKLAYEMLNNGGKFYRYD